MRGGGSLLRFTDGWGADLKYKRRRLLLLKRKHIKIIIILLAVAVAAAVILLVSSANTRRTEKQNAVAAVADAGFIRVGLRGDIGVLCTFNEEKNEYEGLEKDVADEIIRRLFPDGIITRYMEVNSETKDAWLRMGTVDMALGASINLGRRGISYSSSFYADGGALLVMEGTYTRAAELNGKKIAVVQGTRTAQHSEKDDEINVLAEYMAGQGTEVTVKVYASYPEAIDALRSGFVSAVCASEINLKLYGIKGMLILPERFLPSRYCVQVSDGLGLFIDAVNDVIADMREDGTLDALYGKWNLVNYETLE